MTSEDLQSARVTARVRKGADVSDRTLAQRLDRDIRRKHEDARTDVHIIGAPKLRGDIAEVWIRWLWLAASCLAVAPLLIYTATRSVQATARIVAWVSAALGILCAPFLWSAGAQYHRDVRAVASRYPFTSDLLTVFAQTVPDGCVDYGVMKAVAQFHERMAEQEGVVRVVSLAGVAKETNALFHGGDPAKKVIAQDRHELARSVGFTEPDSGLLNNDCSVIPIHIFLKDHRPETIRRVMRRAQRLKRDLSGEFVSFRLAGGNVALRAAVQDSIPPARLLCILGFLAASAWVSYGFFRSFRSFR